MKRLIIICEGPTEKEFCKDVLSKHFLAKDINLECPTIKTFKRRHCSMEYIKEANRKASE